MNDNEQTKGLNGVRGKLNYKLSLSTVCLLSTAGPIGYIVYYSHIVGMVISHILGYRGGGCVQEGGGRCPREGSVSFTM